MGSRRGFGVAATGATALALLCACTAGPPRVVIVSVDGLWARDLDRLDSAGVTVPVLERLRHEGALAEGVIGSLPSVTYPSHTTMVTGVPPAVHGVFNNHPAYDPTDTANALAWYWESDSIRVPTLEDVVHAAGRTVAAVSWPVTAGDSSIALNLPEVWDNRPGAPSNLEVMRRRGTPWLLDSLNAPATGTLTDSLRAAAAAAIIRRWDPDLLLLHLTGLDAAKHAVGPAHDSVWATLADIDRMLGWVVAALDETNANRPTTLIVTSDHGFYPYQHVLRPGVLLARAGLVRLDRKGRVTSWDAAAHTAGGSAALILRVPGDTATVRRLRLAIPDSLIGPDRPIRAVWPPDTVALLGGDPRASWVIDMNQGFYTEAGYTGPLMADRRAGGHGYDPRTPGLRAFFLASGPAVPASALLPVIRQVDIGPTAARALGLSLGNSRGHSLF